MNLDQFVADKNLRNIWIQERDINVYVRKSIRMLDRSTTATPCLDIGSVEVHESHRGQGTFTAFLTQFEKAAGKLKRAVYVESIINEQLVKFLEARGYKFVSGRTGPAPSMFKIIP